MQILRFVYDAKTASKKKLHHHVQVRPTHTETRCILLMFQCTCHGLLLAQLPHILPLGDVAAVASQRSQAVGQQQVAPGVVDALYELSAIVYHRGPGTQAGHYIADVWDPVRCTRPTCTVALLG